MTGDTPVVGMPPPPPPTLRDAIAALLEDPADVVLAQTILGTVDPSTIAAAVEEHVAHHLGRRVVGCLLFTQSVGAVFVLDLDDGDRVVLKAHALGTDTAWRGVASIDELGVAYAAQRELADHGIPCARVIREPAPFGSSGAVAIMSYLPAPRVADPHVPEVRDAMAAMLARITAVGAGLRCAPALPVDVLPPTVFKKPHNALFDFTRPEGAWIDERARAVRHILDADERPIVMHSDFSCANVRVVGSEVVAVYDADSVLRIDEMRTLASIAVHYTYAGDPPWRLPDRAEAAAFVAAYVAARGRALDPTERRRLDAGAIYALAYTARCEVGGRGAGQTAARLATAPDDYLTGALP